MSRQQRSVMEEGILGGGIFVLGLLHDIHVREDMLGVIGIDSCDETWVRPNIRRHRELGLPVVVVHSSCCWWPEIEDS